MIGAIALVQEYLFMVEDDPHLIVGNTAEVLEFNKGGVPAL
jgi:hypothetical protein